MTYELGTRLRSIYTSGDSLTVLELLNRLIKEVEDYEAEINSQEETNNE